MVTNYGISDSTLFCISENVLLEDVIACVNGKQAIIRCEGNPNEQIKVIGGDVHYECIAGMVSEDC